MTLKLPHIVWSFLVASFATFGQDASDSLRQLSPREEMNAQFTEFEAAIRKRNWDACTKHAERLDVLLKQTPNDSALGKNSFLKGQALYYQGQFDAAITELETSTEIYRKLDFSKALNGSQLQLGNVYLMRGDNPKAMEYYTGCIVYYENVKDTLGWTNCLTNIGMLLEREDKYDKAREIYSQSLALKRAIGDEVGVGKTLLSIGTSYFRSNNLSKSNSYLLQAKKVFTKLNDPYGIGKCLSSLGVVQRKLKNYKKALEYYSEALRIKKRMKDLSGIVTTYTNLANVYYDQKEYTTAIRYCDSSLALSEEIGAQPMKEKAYQIKRSSYEKLGEFEKAYEVQKSLMLVKDSMYSANRSERFDSLLVKYESQLKENKILKLAQEKQLTEMDNRLKKAALDRATIYRNWLIFAIVVVLLITYIIWWRMKLKRNLAEEQAELARQKLVEAEKNRQIDAMNLVIEGQELERQRIARELHDSVGSMLSTLKINVEMLSMSDNETVETMIDDVCSEVRKVSHNMMPEALLKFGLVDAIRDIVSSVNTSGKLAVSFIHLGVNKRLDTITELHLYRILQELLNNAIKHAKATEVLVQLNIQDDGINLTVEDNGVGFDAGNQSKGIGMKTIQSRIEILKGDISIDSQPDNGCSIMVTIPGSVT